MRPNPVQPFPGELVGSTRLAKTYNALLLVAPATGGSPTKKTPSQSPARTPTITDAIPQHLPVITFPGVANNNQTPKALTDEISYILVHGGGFCHEYGVLSIIITIIVVVKTNSVF